MGKGKNAIKFRIEAWKRSGNNLPTISISNESKLTKKGTVLAVLRTAPFNIRKVKLIPRQEHPQGNNNAAEEQGHDTVAHDVSRV